MLQRGAAMVNEGLTRDWLLRPRSVFSYRWGDQRGWLAGVGTWGRQFPLMGLSRHRPTSDLCRPSGV